MFKEFKAFVNQGNALDLAVGVLIGAAFGKIVNSGQRHHHPVVIAAARAGDFNNRFFALNGQAGDTLVDAKKGGAVLAYGAFVNNIIEFFIVAFSIFLVVRQVNKWRGTPAAKS
jgi:large conductance mechanosensitive channel